MVPIDIHDGNRGSVPARLLPGVRGCAPSPGGPARSLPAVFFLPEDTVFRIGGRTESVDETGKSFRIVSKMKTAACCLASGSQVELSPWMKRRIFSNGQQGDNPARSLPSGILRPNGSQFSVDEAEIPFGFVSKATSRCSISLSQESPAISLVHLSTRWDDSSSSPRHADPENDARTDLDPRCQSDMPPCSQAKNSGTGDVQFSAFSSIILYHIIFNFADDIT